MKKIMSLLISVALIILVVVSFNANSSAEAATGKPIEIVHTVHLPPPPPPPAVAIDATQSMNQWIADEIKKRTEGRVVVKIAWGAPFGDPKEFLKIVGKPGIADSCTLVILYVKYDLPLSSTCCLPFNSAHVDVQGMAMEALYNEWAPMQKEWEAHNVKPLFFWSSPNYCLTTKTPIRTLEDFKGKNFYGIGSYAQMEKLLGATPVSIFAGDAYDALSKGTLDGVWFPYSGQLVFKFQEQTKYATNMDFFGDGSLNPWVINLDVWNKIPRADQEAIMSIQPEVNKKFAEFMAPGYALVYDDFKAAGIEFISLSSQDQARCKELAVQTIWTEWLDDMEARGVPARECWKRYQELIKKYEPQAASLPAWPSK